jgi:hypothetical protein
MQLTNDVLDRWEQIVKEVDKEHVPVECIGKVVFSLEGKKKKTINFKTLKRQNLTVDEIDQLVQRYIEDNEETIRNMEFILDVQAVAALVEPETNKLLKGIK